jgi:hypothetical protein
VDNKECVNEGEERTREASHCIFTLIGYFADERMPGIIEISIQKTVKNPSCIISINNTLK